MTFARAAALLLITLLCVLAVPETLSSQTIRSEPDTSHPIRINNPRSLGEWTLPAERFAIGPGYKPSMARLPNGELVMVALFGAQHQGKRREWTGLWRS